MLNCVIIEDETNAQEVLLHYVAQTPFLKNLGTYESGTMVPLDIIDKVHFIFLDIELPAINGLAFLRTLNNPPKVIVTTAYPDFAIEAFEQAVVDYMVKPFSYERFLQAVNRMRSSAVKKQDEFMLIYANKTTYKIRVGDILYVKSELDYVSIMTSNEKIMVLESLANWAEKLKAYSFFRIHRSYVVNSHRINKILPNKVVVEKIELPIGPTYRGLIENILRQNLG